MSKSIKNCLWIILAGIIALVLLALLIGFYIVPNFLDSKRTLTSPPSVYVISPFNGEQYPEESILSCMATASGTYPIARVELWLDGELYEEEITRDALSSNLTIVHIDIPIKITVGTHVLYWRAIDNKGQIGQSAPITIIGTEHTDIVITQEGQTLEEIAEALDRDLDVLEDLNPDLGGEEVPVGTVVNLPQQIGGPTINTPPPAGPINTTGAYTLLPADPIINFRPLASILLSALPSAPTGISVGFEDCQVQIMWTDTSDNEDVFNIWVSTWIGGPRIITTLGQREGIGPATYTIPNPGNGYYTFWVETVNALGSQNSEYQEIVIDDRTCPTQSPTELEIEIDYLQASNPSGTVYCYISFEEGLYQQVDVGDTSFLNRVGIWRAFIIPIPNDGEVTIKGECLSHLGNQVVSLGFFNESIPMALWDGSQQEAQGDNFKIGFRIRLHESFEAFGIYRYHTDDLIPPEVTSVEAQTDEDPLTRSRLARKVLLKWDWKGDLDQINNFVIAWDDMDEYLYVGKDHAWAVPITLPASCSNTHEFSVAAVGNNGAFSPYSERFIYEQPDCELYAEVTFVSFEITSHDDNEGLRTDDCDEAELEFSFKVVSADVVGRSRGEKGGTDTPCHIHFAPEKYPDIYRSRENDSITYDFSNKYLVPIEPSNLTVEIGAIFVDADGITYDVICCYNKPINNSAEKWAGFYDEISELCQDACGGESKGTVLLNYNIRGFRTPID